MPPRHTRPAPHARGPVAPVHRGPQAVNHTAAPVAIPFHAPNAALLIDFDNVTMGVRSDLASELKNLLSSDIVKGKVSVQRAYADWRRYPQYIVPLSESSIDLIFAPAYGSSKKNATDIRLAIDALELVFTRPEIGTFILLSGDSDFSSLVIKLKEYGKYVIGVGIRESSSDLLVQNCDEYYSYNALAGLVNTREEEIVKWDPWELASEAVQRMKRNGDVMRADRLKQVMQQIDSSFDEKNLGMSKFSRFVSEASHRGILSLHKMENGQFEVDLAPTAATNSAAAVTSTATVAPSATSSVTPAAASPAPTSDDTTSSSESADDRRGRGRSRRGRGRGREERRPRLEEQPRNEIQLEPSAESQDETPSEPRSKTVSQPQAESDAIGVNGMRLTRDEAFDLVRRAVAASTTGPAVRASNIRKNARELLGRDSESLNVRNFTRILQDAHDADLIDLRRRGDDYDVAPAVSATPITDQLSAVEAAHTPAASNANAAAGATPRGMGPRGVNARGRKPVALPPNLLSVGVVDYGAAAATNGSNESAAHTKPAATRPKTQPTSDAAPTRSHSVRGRKTTAKKAPAKTATAAKAPARKKTAAKRPARR